MYFFKYYRPNIYFEKSIRYNELYFSATNELNDPHDLRASFYFEDSEELWAALLSIKPEPSSWNLAYFLDIFSHSLASELNNLFKNLRFDSISGSLHQEIEKNKESLLDIFSSHVKPDFAGPESQKFMAEMPTKDKAEYCILWLSALLARAVDHLFYSVSFSDSALNPMMWAHYADGFKGCAVIYQSQESSSILLRHNLFDTSATSFEFLKLNYINDEKLIPILECAVFGKAKVQEAFLQKNAFWQYESEHRLFSVERSDPAIESMTKEKRASQRDRILHHKTNDIVGVIFGPRCDERYKKKIDLTLLDNRRRSGRQPFFLFDTQLTRDGRVVISSAKKQCCPILPNGSEPPEGLHQIIDSTGLTNLLVELGIVQNNDSHI